MVCTKGAYVVLALSRLIKISGGTNPRYYEGQNFSGAVNYFVWNALPFHSLPSHSSNSNHSFIEFQCDLCFSTRASYSFWEVQSLELDVRVYSWLYAIKNGSFWMKNWRKARLNEHQFLADEKKLWYLMSKWQVKLEHANVSHAAILTPIWRKYCPKIVRMKK